MLAEREGSDVDAAVGARLRLRIREGGLAAHISRNTALALAFQYSSLLKQYSPLCSCKLLGKGIGSPQSAWRYSFCVIVSMAWLASPLVVLIISVAIIISIVGNVVHLAILILSNTVYLYGNAR